MIVKPQLSRWIIFAVAIVAAFATGVLGARALNLAQPSAVSFGTGFSYQGYLRDNGGQPISDTCTLTFKLYDALNAGNQVGGDDVIPNVAVTNGLFAVQLNDSNEFGAAGFNGGGRYLDITVQCAGDASPSTLSPRQAINPVPYALFAERFAGYENLIIVAKQGGDFTTVSEAMDAIGVDTIYPAASATNPYLIYVAPGVYQDEHVVMKPYVDIQGSGQGVTTLTSTSGASGISPNAATLVGASNAEVRFLTIENKDSTGNWRFAIYTTGNTVFKNVTGRSSGGTDPRGMLVDNGGSPVLIDVSLLADGGSGANVGLDVVLATATADGLFLDVSGGTNAFGAYLNTSSASINLENVTAYASDGSSNTTGIYVIRSEVNLEGYNGRVNGEGNTVVGIYCTTLPSRLNARELSINGSNGGAAGSIRGVLATNCDAEVVDAQIDVGAQFQAIGFYYSSTITETKSLILSQVDIQASSTTHQAYGLYVTSSGSGGAFGKINDITIEAAGNNASQSYAGIFHNIVGSFAYRDISVNLSGVGNFMYGIQAKQGAPDLKNVAVNVYGDAAITTFGIEFIDPILSATLHDAYIRSENIGTKDAVGLKAFAPQYFDFKNIDVNVIGSVGVWGYDFINAIVNAQDLNGQVFGNANGAVIFGLRCAGSSGGGTKTDLFNAQITADVLDGAVVPTTTYGVYAANCDITVSDSDIRVQGASGNRFGFYASNSASEPSLFIRRSYLSGATSTIRTLGFTDLYVTNSQLDGGGYSSGSATDNAECTAVTHGSGTTFAFLAGQAACP